MSDVFQLDTFLPYRLNRAAEFISLRFAATYREKYGMTRPEWRALAALGHYGSLTATEIGKNSTMHKTKVSRAVRALEERRWLTRKKDQMDRRIEHIELTTMGRKYYRELSALALKFDEELLHLVGRDGISAMEKGLSAIEMTIATGPGFQVTEE